MSGIGRYDINTGTLSVSSNTYVYPLGSMTASYPKGISIPAFQGLFSSRAMDFGSGANGGSGYAIDLAARGKNSDSHSPLFFCVPDELQQMKSFTIAGWVNRTSEITGTDGNRIVSWRNSTGGVELVQNSDGSLALGINGPPDLSKCSSPDQIPVDSEGGKENWHFFAVSYDSTAADTQLHYYFSSPTNSLAEDIGYGDDRGPVTESNASSVTFGNVPQNAPHRSATSDADCRKFRGEMGDLWVWGSADDGSGALSLDQLTQMHLDGVKTA